MADVQANCFASGPNAKLSAPPVEEMVGGFSKMISWGSMLQLEVEPVKHAVRVHDTDHRTP